MQLLPKLRPFGMIIFLAVGLFGCATPSGSSSAGREPVPLTPGTSIETAFRAATAAGKEMNYTITGGGNTLVMEKQLPLGLGNIVSNPAKHRNRITVSAVPAADGAPTVIRVEGEYLGEMRNADLNNCISCDVNKIKKAIR